MSDNTARPGVPVYNMPAPKVRPSPNALRKKPSRDRASLHRALDAVLDGAKRRRAGDAELRARFRIGEVVESDLQGGAPRLYRITKVYLGAPPSGGMNIVHYDAEPVKGAGNKPGGRPIKEATESWFSRPQGNGAADAEAGLKCGWCGAKRRKAGDEEPRVASGNFKKGARVRVRGFSTYEAPSEIGQSGVVEKTAGAYPVTYKVRLDNGRVIWPYGRDLE